MVRISTIRFFDEHGEAHLRGRQTGFCPAIEIQSVVSNISGAIIVQQVCISCFASHELCFIHHPLACKLGLVGVGVQELIRKYRHSLV